MEKKQSLFSKTEDFMLLFLTKEDYEKNKNNLTAVQDSPFTSIYGFYNSSIAENTTVFEVSSRTGGSEKISVYNGTTLNCELRLDSPTGETLGYVEAGQAQGKTFMLDAGDYTIFPVFRKMSEANGELYTVTPKLSDGKPYFTQLKLPHDNFLDVTQIYNDVDFGGLTLGGCYLRITNNNHGTAVSLRNGNDAKDVPGSMGSKLISRGETVSYKIEFTKNPDGTIPEMQTMENLVIWAGYYHVQIKTEAGNFKWKCDHIYEINVVGKDASNVSISSVIDKGVMNIKEALGL